jgi:hypothetical protein
LVICAGSHCLNMPCSQMQHAKRMALCSLHIRLNCMARSTESYASVSAGNGSPGHPIPFAPAVLQLVRPTGLLHVSTCCTSTALDTATTCRTTGGSWWKRILQGQHQVAQQQQQRRGCQHSANVRFSSSSKVTGLFVHVCSRTHSLRRRTHQRLLAAARQYLSQSAHSQTHQQRSTRLQQFHPRTAEHRRTHTQQPQLQRRTLNLPSCQHSTQVWQCLLPPVMQDARLLAGHSATGSPLHG